MPLAEVGLKFIFPSKPILTRTAVIPHQRAMKLLTWWFVDRRLVPGDVLGAAQCRRATRMIAGISGFGTLWIFRTLSWAAAVGSSRADWQLDATLATISRDQLVDTWWDFYPFSEHTRRQAHPQQV